MNTLELDADMENLLTAIANDDAIEAMRHLVIATRRLWGSDDPITIEVDKDGLISISNGEFGFGMNLNSDHLHSIGG